MKQYSFVNYVAVDALGLMEKTNDKDFTLLEYIYAWEIYKKAFKKMGYVWINFKHLIKETPGLRIKTTSGISKRIKKLVNLGLILVIKDEDNRLYAKVTDLYMKYINYTGKNSFGRSQKEAPSEKTLLLNNKLIKEKSSSTEPTEETISKNIENKRAVDKNAEIHNDNQQQTIMEEQKAVEQSKFKLTIDWRPDESTLKAMLHMAGVAGKKIDPAWLFEFVGYWAGREDRTLTEDGWTHKFAVKCVGFFRDPASFESLTGICPEGGATIKPKKSYSKPKQSESSKIESINPPMFGDELHQWARKRGYESQVLGMDDYQVRQYIIDKERAKLSKPASVVAGVEDEISRALPRQFLDFINWIDANELGDSPNNLSDPQLKQWAVDQLRLKRDEAIKQGQVFELKSVD